MLTLRYLHVHLLARGEVRICLCHNMYMYCRLSLASGSSRAVARLPCRGRRRALRPERHAAWRGKAGRARGSANDAVLCVARRRSANNTHKKREITHPGASPAANGPWVGKGQGAVSDRSRISTSLGLRTLKSLVFGERGNKLVHPCKNV